MYYLLATGRIVTERQMKLAFEIVHGENANEDPFDYKVWLDTIVGVEEAIPEKNMTITELIKGDAFVEAVKLYRKTYNCTLAEARQAVIEIQTEMGHANA